MNWKEDAGSFHVIARTDIEGMDGFANLIVHLRRPEEAFISDMRTLGVG